MTSINRREMLKLGSATSLAALTSSSLPATTTQPQHSATRQWEVFEIALPGPAAGNPFTEVELSATFSLAHRSVQVTGFYDGSGTYKLRFMPDAQGEWTYTTISKTPELHNKAGKFLCIAPLAHAHGPVSVRNRQHFAYADNTPFFPFGTTCYAWIHQSETLQQQTLDTLRTAPFNKIRMCVFPKHYEYNHNEPPFYPFERTPSGVNDFTRPNPAFFAHLEQRVADLRAVNIEADLILFHPYDRWGYASMPPEADELYLRYILARLSAYRNIWWSLANEYDFMKSKSTQDFDRFFHIVEQNDPVSHLRSVHYGNVMYDYAHPWVTHASLQTSQFERADEWHKAWRKPIVFDEISYEGNLNRRWGNISGEENTRRFWLGLIAGCYVTHGETFLDPDAPLDENTTPTIWWSHGGKLHGTSPVRIAFLRKLVEETCASRTGLEAQPAPSYLNASTLGPTTAPHAILYYMDCHQPIFYDFPLPEGTFTAELIDPWEMKVTPLPGTFSGKTKLKLTGCPFQALRFTRSG